MKKRWIFGLGVVLCNVAFADLSIAKNVFQSGKWAVLRDIDNMTDKVVCTGILGADKNKQLTDNKFYLRIGGGINNVTLRFDDAPAEPFRLATDLEKNMGVVVLNGSEFEKTKSSTRLRAIVGTLVSGLKEFDLDVSGINEALENIHQGCPIPASSLAAGPAPAVQVKSETQPKCSPELMNRMQKAGVTKIQLSQVCAK